MVREYSFGVVVFPGTNCDRDVYHVLDEVLRQKVRYIFHKENTFSDIDCIVLPGGFSYGDYLRTGTIARFSPVMEAVKIFAAKGGLVIGICNGFQILTEAGLLPGAFLRNTVLQFRCEQVHIRVERVRTPFTSACRRKQVLLMPIAHGEGNYYCDKSTLQLLKQNRQIVLRYCNNNGKIVEDSNPNGSLRNIAGIVNKAGNVFGIMPHPERSSEEILGGTDGLFIWNSVVRFLERQKSNKWEFL